MFNSQTNPLKTWNVVKDEIKQEYKLTETQAFVFYTYQMFEFFGYPEYGATNEVIEELSDQVENAPFLDDFVIEDAVDVLHNRSLIKVQIDPYPSKKLH